MEFTLTPVFQQVPEGYIGFVEELPGANTQGATLAETRTNLQEAITLVLEANRQMAEGRLREEFLAGVTEENLHQEWQTGAVVGREVW